MASSIYSCSSIQCDSQSFHIMMHRENDNIVWYTGVRWECSRVKELGPTCLCQPEGLTRLFSQQSCGLFIARQLIISTLKDISWISDWHLKQHVKGQFNIFPLKHAFQSIFFLGGIAVTSTRWPKSLFKLCLHHTPKTNAFQSFLSDVLLIFPIDSISSL